MARLNSRSAVVASKNRVSFEDLLIGATALHLNYSVATFNVRHFGQIPALSIAQL
jgi:predicted nucleic acid-binding protein